MFRDHDVESARREAEKRLDICTPLGTIRTRYQLRAVFQSVTFVCVVAGYVCVNLYNQYTSPEESLSQDFSTIRFLQDDGGQNETTPSMSPSNETFAPSEAPSCPELDPISEPAWWCVWYSIGVLYMFLALAIVCDEFFVPALEEMSGPRRLNLSMDVAGATLMAAGGSAPELFTSLIGTFQESEIGFGTIVGSAVFNVLFVIAMCSLLAKEVLTLTWWPLFRDSLYYAIGLAVLAVLVGVSSPDEVEWWEALILFLMYIGYILLMWKNADLYKMLTGKVLEYPEEDDDDDDDYEDRHNHNQQNKPANNHNNTSDSVEDRTRPEEPTSREMVQEQGIQRENSNNGSLASNISASHIAHHQHEHHTPHFRWQGTFRAGILKLLKDPNSWTDTAGVGIVAKIAGDADYVFQQVDMDGNGHIDREELKQLFNLLECYVSPAELEEVFNQLDEDKDGTISQAEFTNWYCRSEERLLSQVRHVFDKIDADKSNTIDKEELKTLLAMLDSHVTDEDVDAAIDAMYQHGSRDEITFEEFSDWYKESIIYERQKKLIEEDIVGVWDNLYPPKDGSCRDWTWYIIVLPLVALMTVTIPDVTRPGLGKWCYFSFIMSIGWIGFYSWLMVLWAETIGNTVGIPAVIMGLTVLAAGTSVPDLLSSVIVARRGSGDMAVSSSIGSNIFDILVGLPVPWLLFSAIEGKSVVIEAGNIVRSLLILLAMLVFVIAAVHCQGWKLTKTLGGLMILFYIGFLVQAIVVELPFGVCS